MVSTLSGARAFPLAYREAAGVAVVTASLPQASGFSFGPAASHFVPEGPTAASALPPGQADWVNDWTPPGKYLD